MKKILTCLAILAALFAIPNQVSAATFSNEKFVKVFYFEYPGKGSQSGLSAGNAKAIADTDLMAIEAGMVIEKVYAINDTAITGTTVLEVGDDDDPNGFIVDTIVTLATPGMYGYSAKVAGAYLRTETAGGTDAADIYVVPNAKYYSATGKEVKLNVTTANTAGKFRVVVEGYRAAY